MFGIGWAELLIIAVVATVVVPPRDLPRLIRGFGHSVRKLIVHTTETSAASSALRRILILRFNAVR